MKGGTEERRNGGTVERWKGGTAERQKGGTEERKNGRKAERRNGGKEINDHITPSGLVKGLWSLSTVIIMSSLRDFILSFQPTSSYRTWTSECKSKLSTSLPFCLSFPFHRSAFCFPSAVLPFRRSAFYFRSAVLPFCLLSLLASCTTRAVEPTRQSHHTIDTLFQQKTIQLKPAMDRSCDSLYAVVFKNAIDSIEISRRIEIDSLTQ